MAAGRRLLAARARLPPAPTSLANSSALFLGADWHSGLARPGAALYGIARLEGASRGAALFAALLFGLTIILTVVGNMDRASTSVIDADAATELRAKGVRVDTIDKGPLIAAMDPVYKELAKNAKIVAQVRATTA